MLQFVNNNLIVITCYFRNFMICLSWYF